jgi:hypothetical protein
LEIEKSILSYLNIYGNTSKSDLIEFGVNFSGKSKEELAKKIDVMVANGSVQRIVHHLLESNTVYIARVPWALGSSIESAALDVKNKEKLAEEANRIKAEAKTVAENQIKNSKTNRHKKLRTEKKII